MRDKAIRNLYDTVVTIDMHGKCFDENGTEVNIVEEDIEVEIARLVAEYQSNLYKKQRSKQYPTIGDQLDMLWHAIDTNSLNKTSDFYTTLKAVKDAHPKSGE
jgi:hypothetical protein